MLHGYLLQEPVVMPLCTKIPSNFQIILSAGALNSPHILLLSGIGPKQILDHFKIPVVADLPVGKNLRNHVGLTLYFIATKLNNTQKLDWSVFTEYILERKGPMSSTAITQVSGEILVPTYLSMFLIVIYMSDS